MVDVVKIASYISERYKKEYGSPIDEMKLHKLLYFTQRECIIQTGKPMFAESFSAWKYGPVMACIRPLFKKDGLHDVASEEIVGEYKSILDKIFVQYATKSSLSLSALSHREYSWRKARGSVGRDEHSDALIDVRDIEKDAERIRMRRILLKALDELDD